MALPTFSPLSIWSVACSCLIQEKRTMSDFALVRLLIWYIPRSHEFITEYWTLNDSFCYFAIYIMNNIEKQFKL